MNRVQVLEDGDGSETKSAHFHCPGCNMTHAPIVEGPGAWGFNGDLERPTFTPSILCQYGRLKLDHASQHVCHSYVTDGRIQFLSDCTHSLAGQTVEIPGWAESLEAASRPAST